MPQVEIKKADKKEQLKGAVKATFDKKDDYKVVVLKSDKLQKPRLLHKIQADRLIEKKKATEVKDAKLDMREVETVVTVVKQD